MKKHFFLILFLFVTISHSKAQEINLSDTRFPEQDNPIDILLNKYRLFSLEDLNGNIKSISITQHYNYGDDKYYHNEIKHYFDSYKKHKESTLLTIVNDCCGEELENRLDTIFSDKNSNFKKINSKTFEYFDEEDNQKTQYTLLNNKVTQAINTDNEMYFEYNKEGGLITKTGYHIVKGYTEDDTEYVRYKYNNSVKKGYYTNDNLLSKLSTTIYEHYFNSLYNSEVEFTYNKFGKVVTKTENITNHLVKNFDPTKSLKKQSWVDKVLDDKNSTICHYTYDDKQRIRTVIIDYDNSKVKYLVTYTKDKITVDLITDYGTEKEAITSRDVFKLDAKGNPVEYQSLFLDEAVFIENENDTLKISYEYYD